MRARRRSQGRWTRLEGTISNFVRNFRSSWPECRKWGEGGRTLRQTILVRLPDPTQPPRAQRPLVLHVGVDTSSICVPEVEHDPFNRLAGPDIRDLDIEQDRNTRLILTGIMPDYRAVGIVRAFFRLGRQDAAGVGPAVDEVAHGESSRFSEA